MSSSSSSSDSSIKGYSAPKSDYPHSVHIIHFEPECEVYIVPVTTLPSDFKTPWLYILANPDGVFLEWKKKGYCLKDGEGDEIDAQERNINIRSVTFLDDSDF